MNENEKITPEGHSRVEYLLEQLIKKVEQQAGTQIKYGGRVDTYGDLPEEGLPNQFYFVGPVDSTSFDEYIWATPTSGTPHWDRLGSVTMIIDDHLDAQSTNPVQNAVVTLALNGKAALAIVATTFNAASTYSKGNIVVENGGLYIYSSNEASTGAWDATKWTAVTVGSLLEAKANSADLATVATSGSYTDLSDKPTIPSIIDLAKETALAPEFDNTHTYVDGDLMTRNGDLYIADSVNGSYLEISNLFIPSATPSIENSTLSWIMGNVDYVSTSSGQSDIYDISVASGTTYIVKGDLTGITPIGGGEPCSCTASAKYNWGTYIPTTTSGTTVTANQSHIFLTVDRAKKDTSGVWTVSAQKFRKVDVETLLATLSGSIPDAVTVTQTGDVYVGAVCIRKCLTQAEYDLLDPPDERCDYKIVEATT